jgi:hypothetical protein
MEMTQMEAVYEGLEPSQKAVFEEMDLEWAVDDTLIQVLSIHSKFEPLI